MLEPGFYNMDCMDGMREFPDGYFDLAIVDPPYGIGVTKFGMGDGLKKRGASIAKRIEKNRLNSGGGKLKNRVLNQSDCSWDANPPPCEYFDELFRVSKNQIIWGGNYFDLPPTRGFCVWVKEQPFENFSQAEYAWTSFDLPAKVFSYRSTRRDNNEQKIHPTQKPVALYTYLLNTYAKQNDRILDTHVGSASSLVACHRAGFEAWGFEIDPYYYGLAKQRLDKEKSQVTMWELHNA